MVTKTAPAHVEDESRPEAAQKPVHKLQDGRIQVAIWLNDGDDGPWYSVTPRRVYKQGDTWKESGSYGQDDLLVLAKLLDLAHSWCLLHKSELKTRRLPDTSSI
jgi:hypothetical protein